MPVQECGWRSRVPVTASLTLLMLLGGAGALTWRTGDAAQVTPGEVIQDDLYLAGEQVNVAGTVNGDVFAAGNDIRVSGTVNGNLWAAGRNVTLQAKVARSAHLAGVSVTVKQGAIIGSDLLVGGRNLDVASGVKVTRDLAFGGAQVALAGQTGRNAFIGAAATQISGKIGGNATIQIGGNADWPARWTPGADQVTPLPSGLHFGPGGHVGGNLTLRTANHPVLAPGTVDGQVSYLPVSPERQTVPLPVTPRPALPGVLGNFLSISVMGLLLVWLARRPLKVVTDHLRSQPGPSLGYGALTFVGFPLVVLAGVLILGLLATLLTVLGMGQLGVPLGLLGIPLLLGLGALISWLAVGVALGGLASLLGGWVLRALGQSGAQPLPCVLVGALILALLTAVPVLSGLVTFLTLLLGLGAVWLWWSAGHAAPRPPQGLTPLAG